MAGQGEQDRAAILVEQLQKGFLVAGLPERNNFLDPVPTRRDDSVVRIDAVRNVIEQPNLIPFAGSNRGSNLCGTSV
jgi:hypothetical protein